LVINIQSSNSLFAHNGRSILALVWVCVCGWVRACVRACVRVLSQRCNIKVRGQNVRYQISLIKYVNYLRVFLNFTRINIFKVDLFVHLGLSMYSLLKPAKCTSSNTYK